MRVVTKASVRLALPLLPLLLLVGCTASSLGDPCVPEQGPEDGFREAEIYLETNSAQCRTSVCMVYHLEGNPDFVCGTEGGDVPGCVSPDELNHQVFCSCRCSAAEGSDPNLPLCNCTSGFRCDEDAIEAGESGVRGGYCVPCIESGNPLGLDPRLFESC